MMHSSPQPLKVALDLAKRLHHELIPHLTPEQKRDFSRMERLIAEAHARNEADEKQRHKNASNDAGESPRRRGLWAR